MRAIGRELFRAIHEGYWLSVEYQNQKKEVKRYWIAVKGLSPEKGRILADGMQLGKYCITELNLYIESFLEAKALKGTYAPVNEALVKSIRENPERYKSVFGEIANLKILSYLSDCAKMDQSPYASKPKLISHVDDEVLREGELNLTGEQFDQIVRGYEKESKYRNAILKMKQFAMNIISLHTRRGKYVLAFQPLRLDVKNRKLRAGDDIVICTEFTVNETRESIRKYLDPDEQELLFDLKNNAEKIRTAIMANNPNVIVDDLPYLFEISRDLNVHLDSEYEGIYRMYESGDVPVPIQAFFGEITAHSRQRKSYPFALVSRRVNLDQLLAMNHAMRYPLSYVQGPPGTGKTMTIVNTIITAFFNRRTVLLASYNNHPIDEAVQKLTSIQYRNHPIPFPVIRLGNSETVMESLKQMKELFAEIRDIPVPESTLEKNHRERCEQAKQLTAFLDQYETRLELLEHEDAIRQLLRTNTQMNFVLQIETEQLPAIQKKLKELGTFRVEDALSYIDTDFEELKKYLYYTSVRYLKRIFDEKNEDLRTILEITEEEQQVREFHQYLSEEDNLKKFLSIFPIVVTTCISAHRLGRPEPVFDMVIIDEASQCNTAVSLLPILRGRSLLLVGDPQQLQPVILLNQRDSDILRKRYGVSEEYDYCRNSIYKTMLAADAVSDEVLLSHHYRCDPRIIGFNNRKYYNDKLVMEGKMENEKPLLFVDVKEDTTSVKNTAPKEAEEIIHRIQTMPDKTIGIITPFVNQKNLIADILRENNIRNVECGTVHAFQGDEKDVIFFSLCVTDKTRPETYHWLMNNKELINVSTSRAREQLVLVSSAQAVNHLHVPSEEDDIYDLLQYVKTEGSYEVSVHPAESRALGIRPYSTETEEAFLTNLNHALDSAFADGSRYKVHKEVSISQVFLNNPSYDDYFYRGRFDFVVYLQRGSQELPILAIELDGKEHSEEEVVKQRDQKKEKICREHGFELIRVDNTYARRYHYIKNILIHYFRA